MGKEVEEETRNSTRPDPPALGKKVVESLRPEQKRERCGKHVD